MVVPLYLKGNSNRPVWTTTSTRKSGMSNYSPFCFCRKSRQESSLSKMNNLLSIRRRHKSFFFPNRMTRIKIWRTSRCLWSASLLPRPWAATITTKPCDNPVIYFQSSFALIQTRADRWDLKRNGNALKWYNDMNRLQPTDSTWSQRASVSYYYSNVICDLNVSWFIQII